MENKAIYWAELSIEGATPIKECIRVKADDIHRSMQAEKEYVSAEDENGNRLVIRREKITFILFPADWYAAQDYVNEHCDEEDQNS